MTPIQKPCALLRLMAERQGQKITARDLAALQLAVATMEAQHAEIQKHMDVYRGLMTEVVVADAKSAALITGMRALLEVNT